LSTIPYLLTYSRLTNPSVVTLSLTSSPTPLLPTEWEPFTLERYTSETDPDEHLKVYITRVALYTSHDVVFCKAFPTTLKGPTLE